MHARLGDRKPAGHHHGSVRSPQEHAIAADEAEILDQHAADGVDLRPELAVAQRLGVGDERGPIAVPRADRVVEEGDRAVELRRIAEGLDQQVGPLLAGRQPVVGERIHQGHGAASSVAYAASACRAMMTCCTSLAPS